MDFIKNLIKYESYFITGLGMELGDQRWLRKHPINFNLPPAKMMEAYIKVYRRVARIYLKGKGVEKVSIGFNKYDVKFLIKHPGCFLITYRCGHRETLDSLYRETRTLLSSRNFTFRTVRNMNSNMSFSRSVLTYGSGYHTLNYPLRNLFTQSSLYQFLIDVGTALDSLNAYYEAEMAAFKDDLAYVNPTQGRKFESITGDVDYVFNYLRDLNLGTQLEGSA